MIQRARVIPQDNGTPYCDHGFVIHERCQENSVTLELKSAPFREKWRNENIVLAAGMNENGSNGGANCSEHECIELTPKIPRPNGASFINLEFWSCVILESLYSSGEYHGTHD